MIPKGNKGCDITPFQGLGIVDNSSTHTKSSDSYPLGVSYFPLSDYATSVQQNHNFQFFKRDIYQCFLSNAANFQCPRCVVYRAANYVDRFLSVVKVSPNSLEGISWLCFYLADSVGNFRNINFSYNTISSFFQFQYGMGNRDIQTLLEKILSVLGFRLLCPCPYTLCYRALEVMKRIDLCDMAFSFMDCICQQYESININEDTKMNAVLYALSCSVSGDDNLIPKLDQYILTNHQGISNCIKMIQTKYPFLCVPPIVV